MSPLLLVLPLLAAAPSEPPLVQNPDSTPISTPTWYGTQTLIADGAAAALLVGGSLAGLAFGSQARDAQSAIWIVGAAVYLAGAPTIHLRHAQGLTALLDLGLRVGVPFASFFIGAVLPIGGGDLAPLGNGAIGAMVGALAAVAFDAVKLAWTPAVPAAVQRSSFQWTPVVGASRGGTPFAGLGGTF